MPTPSGPFTPSPGSLITVRNPAAGAGAGSAGEVVIVNISPYELVVSSAEQGTAAVVDPFTRDRILVDLSAEPEITIDPLSIGFTPPAGVAPTIYVLWYLRNEPAPGQALPAPIVPYGNLQSVSIVGTANVDVVAGIANPLPVSLPHDPLPVSISGTPTVDVGAQPISVSIAGGLANPLPVQQAPQLARYSISSGLQAVTASFTQTLLLLKGTAVGGKKSYLTELSITTDASAALPAIRWQLYFWVSGIVAGSNATYVLLDSAAPAPGNLTSLFKLTTEPTTLAVPKEWTFQPFGGGIEKAWRLELNECPVLEPGDLGLGVRAIAPAGAACNAVVQMTFAQ